MSPSPILPISPFSGPVAVNTTSTLGPGSHLEGTVTALDREGHPLVRTSQGVLTLPATLALTVGTRVLIELVQLGEGLGVKLLAATPPEGGKERPPVGPTAALPLPTGEGRMMPPLTGFPALQQAIERLGLTRPELANEVLQRLPASGSGAFLTALLRSLLAVRQADLGDLIGNDALRRLARSGERGTAEGARSELSAQQKPIAFDSGGIWQALFVPVFDNAQLRRIGFFVRRPSEDGEDGESRHPVRFLVEAEPSAIGPLQFDGLMIERRLDLIVRSERPLNAVWRDDIRTLFGATIGALGLAGELSFQVVSRFPISGTDAASAGAASLSA